MPNSKHRCPGWMLLPICLMAVLHACAPKYTVASQHTRTYQVRSTAGQASDQTAHAVDSIISPYRDQLVAEMNEVIGDVRTSLYKARPESPLGNFLGDVVLNFCRENGREDVDFVTLNYGGVRIPSIGKGPLTVERIYELMPFDNTLVLMNLSGDTLQQFLNRIADDGGWPISKGISFVIDEKRATNITIGGAPMDPEKTYTIGLPDYIANGGGDCTFLVELPRQDFDGKLIRDILVAQIRQLGESQQLSAKIEGRITAKTK